MRDVLVLVLTFFVVLSPATLSAQRVLDELIDRAARYVQDYERSFALLACDEEYVQWLERPNNPGSNLSRSNPGGGMVAGGQRDRRVVRGDFVLVQLGDGKGWMPFRDILDVNGSPMRGPGDRLVKLFQSGNPEAFDLASQIHDESKKQDIGNVQRTINIPTLAMMFLHPVVRERFRFRHDGDEAINGREVERITYKEIARPTLIKTTRGKDLALEGGMWIDSASGAVVKTELIAADPIVRAQVTVTFRRDGELALWVPERMDEYYKASLALDDIFAVSTFSNHRVVQLAR
jgi:hypothetical protein